MNSLKLKILSLSFLIVLSSCSFFSSSEEAPLEDGEILEEQALEAGEASGEEGETSEEQNLEEGETSENTEEGSDEDNNLLLEDEFTEEAIIEDEGPDFGYIRKKYSVSKRVYNRIDQSLLEYRPLERDIHSLELGNLEDIYIEGQDEEQEVSKDQINEIIYSYTNPVLYTSLTATKDLENYIANVFPQYEIVAAARFQYDRRLKHTDIQGFAAIIGSSVVVMKGLYSEEASAFIYDMYFLDGDIFDPSNYWLISIDQAVSLEESLEKLGVTSLNDYNNIATPVELNVGEDGEIIQEEQPANIDPETGEEIIDETAIDNQAEEQVLELTAIQTSSADGVVTEVFYEETSYELQRKLLAFRVESKVGYWQDIITNEIYEIREFVTPQEEQKYAAFAVRDSTIPELPINTSLNWYNGDLAFIFDGNNMNGLILDYEKMPREMRVNPYPARGVMHINMPNNVTKYLVPVLNEIDLNLYNEFYQPLVTNINLKDNVLANFLFPTLEGDDKVHVSKFAPINHTAGVSNSFFASWSVPIGVITAVFLILAL